MRKTSLKIMAYRKKKKKSQGCWIPGAKFAGINNLKSRMKMPHHTRVRISISKWVVCPYVIGRSTEIHDNLHEIFYS